MLIFGASGAIGSAVRQTAADKGWEAIGVSRRAQLEARPGTDFSWVAYDPLEETEVPQSLAEGRAFDAICWAQGANASDSIQAFDAAAHLELYRANCLYVLASLRQLLDARLLSATGARLCVVSSIWQNIARPNKLSYMMTKSAVGGLVRSTALDLAGEGHLVNAVLPGALDTPMTVANLTTTQLQTIKAATPFGALPSLAAVSELIAFLCSAANSNITGQSVAVDYGFTHGRLL